jgi:hypothetical protein
MEARIHPRAIELTTDEARGAREKREWEVVAHPEEVRQAMAALLAGELPARAHRIRAGFRRTYAAYARRDWEINTLNMHPDEYVFEPADLRQSLPDARDRYFGVEGYLEGQQLLLEVWPDLKLELIDVVAIESDAVITLARFDGRAARSGLELDWMALIDNRFRDGLAISQSFWFDIEAGAAALGIPVPGK